MTTVCFVMHASYKPPTICFALETRHFSRDLLRSRMKCVVVIPGKELANEALFCGVETGRKIDKVEVLGLELLRLHPSFPFGLRMANAHMTCEVSTVVPNGDHDLFVCQVVDYWDRGSSEIAPCLVSIGSNERGYRVLARKGIHRIAIPTI